MAILLLIVSFFMLFPIFFAMYYGELELIRFFLIPMAGALLFALTILLLARKTSINLSTRD